jgi:hypothetical protein
MLRKADVKWSDEMHARLRVLARQKRSYTDIAAVISHEFNVCVSRNACIGKAHRLGIMKKHRASQEFAHRRKPKARAPTLGTASVPVFRPDPDPAPVPKITPRWRVTFDAPAPAGHGRYLLQQLDGNMCHWPYGDRVPYLFCGAPTAGRSYCAYHTRVSCGQSVRSTVPA